MCKNLFLEVVKWELTCQAKEYKSSSGTGEEKLNQAPRDSWWHTAGRSCQRSWSYLPLPSASVAPFSFFVCAPPLVNYADDRCCLSRR